MPPSLDPTELLACSHWQHDVVVRSRVLLFRGARLAAEHAGESRRVGVHGLDCRFQERPHPRGRELCLEDHELPACAVACPYGRLRGATAYYPSASSSRSHSSHSCRSCRSCRSSSRSSRQQQLQAAAQRRPPPFARAVHTHRTCAAGAPHTQSTRTACAQVKPGKGPAFVRTTLKNLETGK